MKNLADYTLKMQEAFNARIKQYTTIIQNTRQSIQTAGNYWTMEMREYFKMSNGLYGPVGRVLALQMRLRNPDLGAAFDPPLTYTPPENSAERQRDDTTIPHHQKTLVDRLMEKLSNETKKRNGEGYNYSAEYNGQRYQNAAYADTSQNPSKKQSGIIYLSKEAFKKMSDAISKLRAVYQRGENNSSNEQPSYNPLSHDNGWVVLQFPGRENSVKYQPPHKTNSIDDIAA